MLRIPTYVAPSQIAGMGLFSAVAIPSKTRIWSFTEGVDWRMTSEEFERFPEPFRSHLRHYVYQEQLGDMILCGDNAKFMNHHEVPNCTDADPRYTVTLRHVAPHEELTCNYLEFDLMSQTGSVDFLRSTSNQPITCST